MSAAGEGAFWTMAVAFTAGFAALVSRLKTEQIDHAAEHRAAMASQSYRTVRTAGERGRILARGGEELATNRKTFDMTVDPSAYKTAGEMLAAIAEAGRIAGRRAPADSAAAERHMRAAAARPFTAFRDLTSAEIARFAEHPGAPAGFDIVERHERTYPQGALAAHAIGRTGRDMPQAAAARGYDYADMEICGRDGLELQYDEYLRGVPGETRIAIDARGFATVRETTTPARKGPDLATGIDLALQRAAENAIAGVKGAFAAIDPRDGTVRALASSPTFDPNDCTPVFRAEVYRKYAGDPDKPLFNRACSGTYAPGSTFKPVTALAALSAGIPPETEIECTGVYTVGDAKIRCARTWGHGKLDMAHAMCESCNPYFCTIGTAAGAEALGAAARAVGLGRRTGIDLPADAAGIVPGREWKEAHMHSRWWDGDTAQMSIGQGQVLASPLQMALAAGAIGSGSLCAPRLNTALPVVRAPLPFKEGDLSAVRRGMALVTARGSGRAAAENVAADVIGKTGTAQVGSGAARRKNTWFIGYATPAPSAARAEPLALAIVVEDGESGGETAAPRAGEVMRSFYGAKTGGGA